MRTSISVAAWLLAAAAGQAVAGVQVYLPRNVEVEADALHLGLVCVVRGDDQTLAERAAAVPLGRAPGPREQIVLDRPMLVSRLATHGIGAGDVQLSGADRVVVTRAAATVAADQIVQTAAEFLEKTRPAAEGAAWRVVRRPADATVPGGGSVALQPRLAPHDVSGEAKVEVDVMCDGRPAATTAVVFRLAYLCREAVARTDIPAGAVLTAENVEIRTTSADRRPQTDGAALLGQVAAQPIRGGAVIRPALVRPPQAPLVVRRNENVVMRVRGSGFLITALGQAIDDGRPGDLVKVRNIDSRRVVLARVADDGAVEPVIEETRQ